MTVARTGEQRAAQDSVGTFARSHRVIEAARDENAVEWQGLWGPLARLGLFGVAVSEDVGGAGGSFADLAAMLEQAGAELIPGPLAATAVGALVCSKERSMPPYLLAAVIDGRTPVAIALTSAAELRCDDAGNPIVTGDLPAVEGAVDDALLLVPASRAGELVWTMVAPASPGVALKPRSGLDFATPLSQVSLTDVAVLGVLDRPYHELQDLYVLAVASMCCGIARRSLNIACEYAKTREQFGQPIGKFQAIKHLCVEMLIRAEQSDVLIWDAAAVEESALSLAVAAAAAVCLDAAVDNTKDCIQILGAIGFTWEHDAHLYLRRALALRHHCGGSTRWRLATVDRAHSSDPRELTVDLQALEHERQQVRSDLARIKDLPVEQRQHALADSGYVAPNWPAPYGRGASTAQQLLINEELRRAGIERRNLIIGWWSAPTILEAGTPAQRDRFIMPTLRGDLIWCQLFSEPEAGSDLASLRTTATRVDGGWRLNGQKVWPTQARTADWAICLARTDRQAPKHKGITYFLVDMRTPGIDVRPLRAITGEPMLNEVFLDDVLVPDDCVLGDVNDGWRLARSTLANERVEMNTGTLGGPTLEVLELTTGSADDVVLDELGSLIAQATANSLLAHRSIIDRLSDGQPGPEASLHKLVGVRQRQQILELRLKVEGAEGISINAATKEFLLTRSLSIAGGSAQVLLSLVGEHMLGLPR